MAFYVIFLNWSVKAKPLRVNITKFFEIVIVAEQAGAEDQSGDNCEDHLNTCWTWYWR